MALVTQSITVAAGTLSRLYAPFEGMSEAQRLVTAVPRGMVRFFSDVALAAKPVNDDLLVEVTGALPGGFAYVISALSYSLTVDRAADFHSNMKFRILAGLPGGPPGNEQNAIFSLGSFVPGSAIAVPTRILAYTFGSLREWYPQPFFNTSALSISFSLTIGNGSDTVQAAGTQFFSCSFYQYELNQAVRFPLNSPVPVGIR